MLMPPEGIPLAVESAELVQLCEQPIRFRPLAENLRRIENSQDELTPLSVRISASTRERLERLIGHLPKRKRAQVLRALLEHAISAAEVEGFGSAVPD